MKKNFKNIKKRIILFMMTAFFLSLSAKPYLSGAEEKKPTYNEINAAIDKLKTEKYSHSNTDLRKFPYPYKAMLAICSDIDGTTLKKFEEYHKFLNTKENSIYGTGLGLDVADSFWLYMGVKNDLPDKPVQDSTMTAFYGTDVNKIKDLDKIVLFYNKGWIDSIHTFGDFSEKNENLYVLPTRRLDMEAWDILNKYNLKPTVWINHGNQKNIQNFGGYSTRRITSYQQGDNPDSESYHTDITIKNGIRFVWNSIGSTEFGMDNPLYKLKLRDGQTVWGFNRFTNVYDNNKLVWVWEPEDMAREMTREDLDNIVKKNQYSIVTNHFGEGNLNEAGISALKTLAEYQNEGKILVARTSRLLEYDLAQNYVKYATTEYEGTRYINIESIDDPVFGKTIPTLDQLRGITFDTNSAKNTVLLINYKPVDTQDIVYNEEGKQTIGIKWFSPDYTDYTKVQALGGKEGTTRLIH